MTDGPFPKEIVIPWADAVELARTLESAVVSIARIGSTYAVEPSESEDTTRAARAEALETWIRESGVLGRLAGARQSVSEALDSAHPVADDIDALFRDGLGIWSPDDAASPPPE